SILLVLMLAAVAWLGLREPDTEIDAGVVSEAPTHPADASLASRDSAELLALAESSTPGNLELARDAALVVLRRSEQGGDQASQGRATLQLGLVAHHAGEQTKAVSHLLAARDLLRRTDDRAALAKALEQLAATMIPLGSQPELIEASLDRSEEHTSELQSR